MAVRLQHPRSLAQVRLKVLNMLCTQHIAAFALQCLIQFNLTGLVHEAGISAQHLDMHIIHQLLT